LAEDSAGSAEEAVAGVEEEDEEGTSETSNENDFAAFDSSGASEVCTEKRIRKHKEERGRKNGSGRIQAIEEDKKGAYCG
jgi:hypothetical protein